MIWFQVIILGAIILDIVAKFISVKQCQDILKECVSWAQVCKEVSGDANQARIDISRSVAKVDMMRDDCEDQLKTTKAMVNGLGKDQYDIWEMIHSINAAVDGLNKRLTNPRDLEPEWKPVDEETDYLPFTDPGPEYNADQDI